MRHVSVRTSLPVVLAAGAALLLALPAAASGPVQVDLGVHRFGHLTSPAAVVARATAAQVGWNRPEQGGSYGPSSFDIGRDGTAWLLDVVNNRLVRWSAGQPSRPSYLALPYKVPEDFAVAADGGIYVLDKPAVPDHYRLYALTSTGAVRWWVDVEALDRNPGDIVRNYNSPLRFGPDGTLYEVGGADVNGKSDSTLWWTPLTTPAGAPLAVAQMWSRRLAAQPLPGGQHLTVVFTSNTQIAATVTTATGRVATSWRITSRSPLWGNLSVPEWVGGSLVMSADVSKSLEPSAGEFETVVLRLPSSGGPVGALTLDVATWGDTITTLRAGPDGDLYQLRSDPASGVSIASYTLPAATAVTPPPSSTTPPSSSTPPTTTTPNAIPTTTPPQAVAPTPPAGGSGTSPLPWVLGGTGAAAVAAAGGGWLRYRHTHAHTP